jgi:hypothetical protein
MSTSAPVRKDMLGAGIGNSGVLVLVYPHSWVDLLLTHIVVC